VCDTIRHARNSQIAGVLSIRRALQECGARFPRRVPTPPAAVDGILDSHSFGWRGRPTVGLAAGVPDFDGQVLWSLAVRRAAEGVILRALFRRWPFDEQPRSWKLP
jgi:hypothetical protein